MSDGGTGTLRELGPRARGTRNHQKHGSLMQYSIPAAAITSNTEMQLFRLWPYTLYHITREHRENIGPKAIPKAIGLINSTCQQVILP